MSELKSIVESMAGKKIIVVGDCGLDEYVSGQVSRISPEAPVPVVDVENQNFCLGLSANVAQNIKSLGGEPLMVSVSGEDEAANFLREALSESGVSHEHILVDKSRPTTRKLRVMAGPHHIVRVDYEKRRLLNEKVRSALVSRVAELLPLSDAVIIQDYAKGVVSRELVEEISRKAKAEGKKVLVDPHRSTPLNFYKGVDVFKPNWAESLALSGEAENDLLDQEGLAKKMARRFQEELGAASVVVTRGKDGMSILDGANFSEVPTVAKQVFDVTGAGDTVIASLAMALVSGASLHQACQVANEAAGIVVAQVGCVACKQNELLQAVVNLSR